MPAPTRTPQIPDPPIHPAGPNDPKPKARNATAAAADQLVNVGNLDEEEPSLGRPGALARFEREGPGVAVTDQAASSGTPVSRTGS